MRRNRTSLLSLIIIFFLHKNRPVTSSVNDEIRWEGGGRWLTSLVSRPGRNPFRIRSTWLVGVEDRWRGDGSLFSFIVSFFASRLVILHASHFWFDNGQFHFSIITFPSFLLFQNFYWNERSHYYTNYYQVIQEGQFHKEKFKMREEEVKLKYRKRWNSFSNSHFTQQQATNKKLRKKTLSVFYLPAYSYSVAIDSHLLCVRVSSIIHNFLFFSFHSSVFFSLKKKKFFSDASASHSVNVTCGSRLGGCCWMWRRWSEMYRVGSHWRMLNECRLDDGQL